MTSNAGSERSESLMGFGKTQGSVEKEKAEKALREFLRPEFIARVDEIVVFSPLDKESLKKISALMLDELKAALEEKLIKFSYTDEVCAVIAEKCSGTKTGARELRNIIRREIEDPAVDMIIDGGEGSIGILNADVSDGKITLSAK